MNILEEFIKKHEKELKKLVENKFVCTYHRKNSYPKYTISPISGPGSFNPYDTKEHCSLTIVKLERPMTVSDLFTQHNLNEDYKKIYELELELEELRKLKSSIVNIKSVLGEIK